MSDVLTQPWPDSVVGRAPIPHEVELEGLRRLGFVLTTTHFVGSVRWLNRLEYEVVAPHCLHVGRRLLPLIAIVSAHANRCRHCYGAVRASLLLMGFDDATITALQGDVQASQFPSETKRVLEFTRLMVIAEPRYRHYLSLLREAGFEEIAVREIAYYVAITASSHRINTPLAIPPDSLERLVTPGLLPITRVVSKGLRRWTFRRLTPAPDPAAGDAQRPFAKIIEALEGSPAGLELGGITNEALASPFTSLRMKGLIYSIVARTVNADYAEAEGRALLSASGADNEAINGVLDHLRHPSFSEDELAVAAYARETVRYQVPSLQRTLRELAKGKPRETIVDIVGQAAFANSIARMSVLVDHPER
jgi:AhpD family alkylhydroperoxidase